MVMHNVNGEVYELSPEKAGTDTDRLDMRRMGKAQEFKVSTTFAMLEERRAQLLRSGTLALSLSLASRLF